MSAGQGDELRLRGGAELDLAVKPSPGSAIYFEYCNSQSQLDARLLHGGAPVTEGEKWIATKWVRQSAYVTAPAA